MLAGAAGLAVSGVSASIAALGVSLAVVGAVQQLRGKGGPPFPLSALWLRTRLRLAAWSLGLGMYLSGLDRVLENAARLNSTFPTTPVFAEPAHVWLYSPSVGNIADILGVVWDNLVDEEEDDQPPSGVTAPDDGPEWRKRDGTVRAEIRWADSETGAMVRLPTIITLLHSQTTAEGPNSEGWPVDRSHLVLGGDSGD